MDNGDVMYKALACDSRGREFDFRSFHCYLGQVLRTRVTASAIPNYTR